jgi:putative ABC transport system substrate-binding protein
MERRAFVAGAAALLAAPLAAKAQQAGRVYRIGVISSGSPSTSGAFLDAFRQRLRELGYTEGRNVTIESRYAAAQSGRFHGLATELVGLGVDVIVASGTLATRAAKQVTSSIPIVMVSVGDAVGAGLVESLPKPGRNITDSRSWAPSWPSKGSTYSPKPSRGHRA